MTARRTSRSPRTPVAESTEAALPTTAWKNAFRKSLRAWFDRERRDLPWRRSRDPYAVWVSEIMLQQTQVATVIDYFNRFTAAFPTVAALAAADEHDVLRHWEGLGYYRRARQMHRAAQVIVAEHGGKFPNDAATIRTLPGIGRYTAGAIASIAFDLPEPILEANTVRLFSRLAAFRGDPHAKPGQDYLWQWAAALVPTREPGLFNQALMELGALICTPREPRCGQCPVARHCPTFKLGLQREIPRLKKPPKFEDVHEGALIVRQRGTRNVLLVQRAEGQRWAGLWDFPRFTLAAEQPANIAAELQQHAHAALGLKFVVGERLYTLKYGVTRFRITLDAFAATTGGGRLKPVGYAAAQWVPLDELPGYPLNVSARKLAQQLRDDETGLFAAQ